MGESIKLPAPPLGDGAHHCLAPLWEQEQAEEQQQHQEDWHRQGQAWDDASARQSALDELPSTVQGALRALEDEQEIRLKVCSLEALKRIPADTAEKVLSKAYALAASRRLLNPDGFVVSSCWRDGSFSHGNDSAAPQRSRINWWDWSGRSAHCHSDSSTSSSSHVSSGDAASFTLAANDSGAQPRTQGQKLAGAHEACWEREPPPDSAQLQGFAAGGASDNAGGDAGHDARSWKSDGWADNEGAWNGSASCAIAVTQHRPPPPAAPAPILSRRLRLARDDDQDAALQARSLRQERRDACICAALYAAKGLCCILAAVCAIAGFALYMLRSGGGNYMTFYFVWPALALAGGLLVRTRAALQEGWEYWVNTTRVHIVLRAAENLSEFKAVGRYLESCGMMTSHLRLRIQQDEDDVEEVHLHYTPWARSFCKRACIYGDTGDAASIEFRTFCPGRYLPYLPASCLCRGCRPRAGGSRGRHGHFEVHYHKAGEWGSSSRGEAITGDTIVFSVPDHHAEAIENFILQAHAVFMQPRNTKVEVYAAAGAGEPGNTSASWEFMQYISPLAQERTGRFTYVPGAAFAQIEEEYRRIVSIGNESLTVLVTGASRAGKSAMVTALAHRLNLPVYSLNLKARFLTDGGIESLFSHRAIPHRPVLVHIEEFSMMFQETVAVCSTGSFASAAAVADDANAGGNGGAVEAGEVQPRYEGLQSSSALNCSDLLKLFDQSGTTSPKRIFFVLTCIELPEQFDCIKELRPLLARGRIQHYRLEEPTDEVIAQYILQYFHPEPRRAALSAPERQHLVDYTGQMKARLGRDCKNWHAVKKHAEIYSLGR